MIGQPARQIAVEHIDDLHADLHPTLPCRHRERKPFAWNPDFLPRRTLHFAAGEGAKRRFKLAKQLRWIEVLRHLGLAQAEHLPRALLDLERSFAHTEITECYDTPTSRSCSPRFGRESRNSVAIGASRAMAARRTQWRSRGVTAMNNDTSAVSFYHPRSQHST